MARIGDVWDSTLDAARGRAGVIAPVALLGFFLPGVVQSAVAAWGDPQAASTGLLLAAIALVAAIAAVWSQLTIIGITTDPATTRAEASAQAWRRFLPVLGVSLLIGLGLLVLAVPLIGALAASGIDWRAVAQAQPGTPPDLSGASTGAVLFAFFYMLLLLAVFLALGVRLLLVSPVVLHERIGAGAIRRSLALTRGMTWKLLGVLLLYLAVLFVAAFAVQSVVFFLIRLPLGAGATATATFVAAIAAGVVTTVFSALFCVFTARLYVATGGWSGVTGGTMSPHA